MNSSSRDACKNSRRLVRKSAGARNYDENLVDELIDMHLGAAPRKKRKTMQELEKETETEAMIALSLGFPIDALLDEEIEAGVVDGGGGADRVNDYIVVRNHILSKWRDNVSKWLSIGQIRETVSKEYEALISAAYDFLTSRGFINFGVVHPPRPIDVAAAAAAAAHSHPRQLLLLDPNNSHHLHNAAEMTNDKKKKKKDDDDDDDAVSVIVVGSGLAGLAAAGQLLNFGFKVIVLEGRSRPGGRAYTERIGSCRAADKEEEGGACAAAVDLGGSVITGIHANPLGVVARQLCLPLHKVRDKCPLYWPDGVPVDEETDAKVETVFNKLLDKATQLRQLLGEATAANISLGSAVDTLKHLYGIAPSGDETQLLDWHLANLEYANAGQLSMLSLAHWDQDDPYEMGGDHCLLAGGNGKLIDALCRGIPIYYGRTVHGIKYGIAGVEVAAGDQLFQADMALCTVPLGVLKKKVISFEPELPTRKLEAINRLGYGLLNKIALIFPYVFWEEDLDTFGSVNKDGRKRGEYFLFYSYHMVSGGPVLIALVAGESASCFERAQPTDLLHRVLSVLRGRYHAIRPRAYLFFGCRVSTLTNRTDNLLLSKKYICRHLWAKGH